LTHDKGVEELVQASMDLAHEGRDIRLLMIGAFESGDPVHSECARLISTNALIHATGYIDDPAPYYRAMDLFAFPSHREGLGNVLLEAAAAGRPTVATRVTGCVDAIEDGVTGVLVPAHDSNALKIAIADLMDNAAKRQSMSTAAQIFVREYFDAAKMLDALAAFMAS
jgi:glycosyltransferase involved in cell wall biosynthesis